MVAGTDRRCMSEQHTSGSTSLLDMWDLCCMHVPVLPLAVPSLCTYDRSAPHLAEGTRTRAYPWQTDSQERSIEQHTTARPTRMRLQLARPTGRLVGLFLHTHQHPFHDRLCKLLAPSKRWLLHQSCCRDAHSHLTYTLRSPNQRSTLTGLLLCQQRSQARHRQCVTFQLCQIQGQYGCCRVATGGGDASSDAGVRVRAGTAHVSCTFLRQVSSRRCPLFDHKKASSLASRVRNAKHPAYIALHAWRRHNTSTEDAGNAAGSHCM